MAGLGALVSVIVATLCLVCLAAFLAITLKRTLLRTFVLAIGFVVAVLFCFGMLNFRGCLMVGYVVIVCLSLAAGVYSVLKIKEDRRLIKNRGLVHGALALLLFVALSIFWHYGRLLTPGDEFTHWGAVVKHMYMMDAFGTLPGSTVLLKGYLPGVSLFEYFFVALSSGFAEWTLFVAINLLVFAIIAHIISGLDTARKALIVTSSAIVTILFTYSFDYLFFNALSVDVILALLFTFTIVSVLDIDAKTKPYHILVVASGCMLLVLAKDMGLILALVCVLTYATDTLFFKRKLMKTIAKSSGSKWRTAGSIIVLGLPILASTAPYLLWKFNTEVNRVQPWFDTSSINIANVVEGDLQPYQSEVITSFIDRIVSSHISGFRISYLATMVIFLVCIVIVAFVQKDVMRGKRIASVGLVVTAGSVVYSGVLLVLYMFVFFPGEAVILASYSRYLGTYALAAMLILLILLISRETKLSKPLQKLSGYIVAYVSVGIGYIKKHLFVILICGACVAGVGKMIHIRSYVSERIMPYFTVSYERVDEKSADKWVGCLSNPHDTLNIVSSGDNGSRTTQLRYIFYGVAAQIPTGITGPINAVKTTPQYSDYWSEYVLRSNTLVYIDRYDTEFYKQHASDFDELKNDQLYRITKEDNKAVLKSIKVNACSVVQ